MNQPIGPNIASSLLEFETCSNLSCHDNYFHNSTKLSVYSEPDYIDVPLTEKKSAADTAPTDLPGGVEEKSERKVGASSPKQKLDLKIFSSDKDKKKSGGVLGAINQYLNTD